MKELVQYGSSIFGAGFGYLLGDFDGFLYALIIFMVLDYITGMMIAISNKEISSSDGFKEILKKCTMLFMVVIANIIDTKLLNNGDIVRTAVIFFYISNEGISLLENANTLGVPVPNKLVNVLKKFEEETEIKEKM